MSIAALHYTALTLQTPQPQSLSRTLGSVALYSKSLQTTIGDMPEYLLILTFLLFISQFKQDLLGSLFSPAAYTYLVAISRKSCMVNGK